jgi:arylsulfatase
MPASRPNVLVVVADDLGWFDLSCYHQGLMGGRTPNFDRIASAGARFTDFYGQSELHRRASGTDHGPVAGARG